MNFLLAGTSAERQGIELIERKEMGIKEKDATEAAKGCNIPGRFQ